MPTIHATVNNTKQYMKGKEVFEKVGHLKVTLWIEHFSKSNKTENTLKEELIERFVEEFDNLDQTLPPVEFDRTVFELIKNIFEKS